MKEIRDKKAIEEYGFRVGKEEGIEKGIQKGIEKGINKEKIEIAKKMLLENIDINLISKLTGLTKEEIKNLE